MCDTTIDGIQRLILLELNLNFLIDRFICVITPFFPKLVIIFASCCVMQKTSTSVTYTFSLKDVNNYVFQLNTLNKLRFHKILTTISIQFRYTNYSKCAILH